MASNKNNSSKICQIWEKYSNPLRGLTQNGIESMYMNARLGNDTKLQYAFYEIERNTPIYNICIEKRLAGVTNRLWDILPQDDSKESKKQAEFIKKIFLECDTRNEDGLTDAIRHLVMSVFRGRSAVKPFFDDNDKLILKPLQNWNLLYHNNGFYWNADCQQTGWLDDGIPDGIIPLPKDEICYLLNERPVDIPGLTLYLRLLIGEEQFARFTEKCGIPQVILTTPEGTPDEALELWNHRAQAIFEGGSGSLAAGAGVHLLTEGRSSDIFSSYIQHQVEQISIQATGGTLMTIGGSTGLGSDLARVQQESFNSLVSLDCKRISNAITNSVVRKCVKKFFNTDELKIRFEFIEDDDVSVDEYLTYAERAKNLGLSIDVQELKRLTKLSFINDEIKDVWSPEKRNEEGTVQ